MRRASARYAPCGFAAGLALAAWLAGPAAAQWQPMLGDVDIATEGGCTAIRIGFAVPTVYLDHFPSRSGETLIVFVRPLGLDPRDEDTGLTRETALVPRGAFPALRGIEFEGGGPGRAYLTILFAGEMTYEVQQGRDYRSIVIHVFKDGASPCPRDP